MYYLRSITQIKHVEWDVATLTAGDYTVDMKITHQQYCLFLSQHKQSDESIGYGLKKHLKQELELKLTKEVPSMGFEEIEKVKIADI